MGCRILDGGDDGACLYCSTTMTAFGPVFSSYEHAEDFLKWLDTDPRRLNNAELDQKLAEWINDRVDENGDLKEPVDTSCPQCEGTDYHCTYCEGVGMVTETRAEEWHRKKEHQ